MNKIKNILIVSHCILNINSKVEGSCKFENTSNSLIKYLIDNDYGIIQLPCPEITMYGIKRWGHVKEQFDTPYYRKHCRNIFEPILDQIIDYIHNDYKIQALLAISGSPSCGYKLTCSSPLWGGEFTNNKNTIEKINDLKLINNSGIFIEEIQNMLLEKNISMNIISIDEENKELTMENIKKLL